MPPQPRPRPYQAPDLAQVRANARALYDRLAPTVRDISEEQNERYRAMFAEGYLRGFAEGGVFALAQFLPEAPDSPEALADLPPAPPENEGKGPHRDYPA